MTKEISTGHLAVVPCGDLFRHIYDLRKFSSCWGHRTLVVTGPAILGTARSAHFAPHAPRPRAGGHRGHCGRGGSGHLLVLPLAAVSWWYWVWCWDQMDLTNNCLLTPCFIDYTLLTKFALTAWLARIFKTLLKGELLIIKHFLQTNAMFCYCDTIKMHRSLNCFYDDRSIIVKFVYATQLVPPSRAHKSA